MGGTCHSFQVSRLQIIRQYGIWKKLGEWERIAEIYEKEEKFSNAAQVWIKLDRKERAEKCAEECEKKEQFSDEAKIYAALGDKERARELKKLAHLLR